MKMNIQLLLEYCLIGLVVIASTVLMALRIVDPTTGFGAIFAAVGYVFGSIKSSSVLNAINAAQK